MFDWFKKKKKEDEPVSRPLSSMTLEDAKIVIEENKTCETCEGKICDYCKAGSPYWEAFCAEVVEYAEELLESQPAPAEPRTPAKSRPHRERNLESMSVEEAKTGILDHEKCNKGGFACSECLLNEFKPSCMLALAYARELLEKKA